MRTRPGVFVWLAGVVAAAILGGLAVSAFLDLRTDFERADAKAEARAEDIDALRTQLIELGETPDVETPSRGETGDRGLQGERGERGPAPTFDQVFEGVAAWLRLNPPVDQPDPDDPETQEPEIQDPDLNDPEVQDDEIQDGEIDDPDPDDPETQDPEIDDPDPDSNACPAGYSWQPFLPNDDERLICTKDPAPSDG